MNTQATAPKPVAQPLRATVSFLLTESQAAKCGLLERWQRAMRHRERRAQERAEANQKLQQSVSRLLARAESEQWSQRTLAKKIGIPETTFRRIRAQQVDPMLWLPKLRSAAARLQCTLEITRKELEPCPN